MTKERFVENYSSARLFQINSNQKIFKNLKEKRKFELEFLTKIRSYKNIVIFDYGHGYIDRDFAAKFNKLKKFFFINCQTNSYNFGFNLFTKYNKSEILCIDETEFRLTIQDKENTIEFLLLKNIKLLSKHKIFIVTSGANGCYVLSNKKVFFVPAVFKTTLDTTGCDVFFSSFVYFYLQEKFNLKEISFLSHLAAGLHGLDKGNKNIVKKNNFFQTAQSVLK